jgi:type II secretory pathway pseudopilin PulG
MNALPSRKSARTRRSEAGDTLIEVLLTLIVLSLAAVSLMIAFGTSITASAEHRSLATNDVVLRGVADTAFQEIQQAATPTFSACATSYNVADNYGAPTGFTVATQVQDWIGGSFVAVPSPCTTGSTTQLVTLTVTNPNGTTESTSIVVDNRGEPSITTANLPSAEQALSYSASLAGTGGVTPYTWSISSGSLPTNLSLNSANGFITGTVTASSGSYPFTVTITGGNGVATSESLSITVVPAPSITTATLPSGPQSTSYYANLVATGGVTPYTWSISSGSLPSGLSLDPSTGVISGTLPSLPKKTSSETFTFTVTLTDASYGTDSQQLSIEVTS